VSKTPFIDEFLKKAWPPERVAAADNLLAAMDRLATLQFPLTPKQRAESERVARSRGYGGPFPWQPCELVDERLKKP
jgi:hypothetical protein